MFDDWIHQLSHRSVARLDRPALCAVIAGAAQLRSAAEAFEARALAAVDGLSDRGASASVVARAAARCSQREADRRAGRAATLAKLPEAVEALAEGRLSSEHIESLSRAVDATSAEAVGSSGLVERACRRPADLYARDTREWIRHQQTDTDVERAHRRRHHARRLAMFENDDGMFVLHGEFDPVTGARLRSALDTETDRLFHADGGREEASRKRTPAQRRADALAGLLSHPGDSQAAGSASRATPVRNQVLITATLEGGDVTDSRMIDGSPLPATVIERLACGSDLFALVLSAAGDPLWIGRRTRLATDGQWRALIVRDGGCGICDAHPSKCEAHHIVAWQPPGSGPTDIDNLVLLCSHHHHLVHDLGARLMPTADGGWCLEPP